MGKQCLGPNTARRKQSVAFKRRTTLVGSGDAVVIWTLGCGPSTVIPSGLFGLSLRWSLVVGPIDGSGEADETLGKEPSDRPLDSRKPSGLPFNTSFS
jgi:hypothetical protein